MIVAFIAYVAILLKITIFEQMTAHIQNGTRSNNFVPFSFTGANLSDPQEKTYLMLQLVANVLLFVPFGMAVPFILKKPRYYPLTLVFALVLTVSIEAIQVIIGRVCDVDDVICNFLGATIGLAVFLVIWGIVKLAKRKRA